MKQTKGFTLLELLIVIAIIAILATIIILVLNPAELLRRSRDTARISDLSTIKTTIALYMTEIKEPDLSGDTLDGDRCSDGAKKSVFVSVPQGTANYPYVTGFGTASSTAADLPKIDGTGWLPVRAMDIVRGAPLSAWPKDPVNTTSVTAGNNLLYVYTCNQDGLVFMTAAKLESYYYKETYDYDGNDGGTDINAYEVGTDLYTSGPATTALES